MKFLQRIIFCALIFGTLALRAFELNPPELCPVEMASDVIAHPPLELVKDGKIQFVISAPLAREQNTLSRSSKSIAEAVKILGDAFEKCAGQRPEVFDTASPIPAGKPALRLFVGDCPEAQQNGIDFNKLPDQGFAVKSLPNGILLVGKDTSLMEGYNTKPLENLGSGKGTQFAAYDFAERFLGIRHYFPGPYGSLYPAVANLTITPVSYVDFPRLNRRMGAYYLTDSIKPVAHRKYWEKYLGTLTEEDFNFHFLWRTGGTAPAGGTHCPHPRAMGVAFPNDLKTVFYTAPSGRFYYNPKQHLGNYFNVFDLKFADLLVASMKKYYDSNGKDNDGGHGFKAGLNLTYASFGCCDTLLPESEVLADPIVKQLNLVTPEDVKREAITAGVYGRFHQYLANKIAQEMPGRKLMILAYYNAKYASLDPRWTLPGNTEIMLCLGEIAQRARNPEVAARNKKILGDWLTSLGGRPVKRLWVYDSFFNKFARAVDGEFLGDTINLFGKDFDREEIYFDHYGAGAGDMWHYYSSSYAVYRLMWNPDWNAAKGIDAHFAAFYGEKAGAYLREFHQLNRKNFLKFYVPASHNNPVYPLPDLKRMAELLQLAKKEIAPDSVEMKRFELFSAPWEENIKKQISQHSYELPTYSAYQLLSRDTVQLDGVAGEAFWNKVKSVPLMDPNGTGNAIQHPATIKLAWNSTGIYGLIHTDYVPLADTKKDVWQNCSFEFFLSPGMKREDMVHIAFDPLKQTHFGAQRFFPIVMPYDNFYKIPEFRLESVVTDKGWTAEFFLPFTAFGERKAKAYDVWTFNAVRNKNAAPKEISSSSMTLKDNFNISAYGNLRFAGKGE